MTETLNSSETVITQLVAQMEAMQEKLARQETLLQQQQTELSALKAVEPVPSVAPVPTDTSSRRRMLKKMGAVAAGLAVAGAVGSAIGSANPAYADDGKNIEKLTPEPPGRNADGGNLIIGQTNNSTARTFLGNDGTASRVLLVSATASTLGAFPSAIAGAGLTTNAPTGVYGFTNQSGGYGIVGSSSGFSGTGGYFLGGQANLLLDTAGAAPPSRSDAHIVGEIINDGSGNLWYCIVAGTPGTWRKLQGPATSGALHVFPSPGRFLDSRPGSDNFVLAGNSVPSPIPGFAPAATPPGGNIVSYKITGAAAKGSGPTIPNGATAILGNITVIAGAGADGGYVLTWPSGGAIPSTSTINYNSNQVIANSFVSGLSSAGRISIAAYQSTNIIIDVVGYYL